MLALTVDAPAKINLSLAVVGRRGDGYHQLAGVMALVDLRDTLTLTPGCSGLRVNADPSDAIPIGRADNLAWRGLVAGLGSEPDITCLTLEKRIPVGAGLGGGSSDAAAAWQLGRVFAGQAGSAAGEAGDPAMQTLAAIGADVPFFASGHAAAYVTGVGEHVRAVDPRDGYAVLALPRFRLSTAAVFAELRRSDWSGEAPAPTATPGHNDLLAPARRLRPEIDDLLRDLASVGADPHMTGSGPCCFALTDDPERATSAVRAMTARGARTILTRLASAPYRVEELAAQGESEDDDA
ncbi:MAG: 4-(cytidine 5'-diphospho)-2-C-methyl-D-erythritol kinase [Chloroflexota bacterium]|nr:4-(cytidine 5'-diphospho)-2-C-methyl-D-erythritol kinase [Chloroflexota bacterium]